MTNPFDATDDVEFFLDPWVGYSRMTLFFVGGAYVLLGAAMGLAFPSLLAADPTVDPEVALAMGGTFGVIIFVFCAFFGVLNFLAAFGLGQRAKWAWIMTLILGAIYAPSACLPFGAVLLYGMLNDRTRKAFMG
jgi:hypothetical protein